METHTLKKYSKTKQGQRNQPTTQTDIKKPTKVKSSVVALGHGTEAC